MKPALRPPPSVFCRPPSALRRPTSSVRGFTLIELLTVIAIIGILATITITASRGVMERSRIARAKADMAALAAALEQYKLHYGDYPWTPALSPPLNWDGPILLNALAGNIGPKGNVLSAKGRTFVELGKFELRKTDEASLPASGDTTPVSNWMIDPWDRPYYYLYKKSESDTNWKSPSFLLYSHGPDGECNLGADDDEPKNTGLLENFPSASEAINADNIYQGHK